MAWSKDHDRAPGRAPAHVVPAPQPAQVPGKTTAVAQQQRHAAVPPRTAAQAATRRAIEQLIVATREIERVVFAIEDAQARSAPGEAEVLIDLPDRLESLPVLVTDLIELRATALRKAGRGSTVDRTGSERMAPSEVLFEQMAHAAEGHHLDHRWLAMQGYKQCGGVRVGHFGLKFHAFQPIAASDLEVRFPEQAPDGPTVESTVKGRVRLGAPPVLAFYGTDMDDLMGDVYDDALPQGVGYRQTLFNMGMLDELLTALHRDHGLVALAGHSLGGANAQNTASLFPQHVASVHTYQSPGINGDFAKNLQDHNKSAGKHKIRSTHYHVGSDVVEMVGDAWTEGTFVNHEVQDAFDPTIDSVWDWLMAVPSEAFEHAKAAHDTMLATRTWLDRNPDLRQAHGDGRKNKHYSLEASPGPRAKQHGPRTSTHRKDGSPIGGPLEIARDEVGNKLTGGGGATGVMLVVIAGYRIALFGGASLPSLYQRVDREALFALNESLRTAIKNDLWLLAKARGRTDLGPQPGGVFLDAPHDPSLDKAPGGTPWFEMFKAGSSPAAPDERGCVHAEIGLSLRSSPDLPGMDPRTGKPMNWIAHMELGTRVTVLRRTNHLAEVERWCYVMTDAGQGGFCQESWLTLNPPEPAATLHRVAPGETLGSIADREYRPPGGYERGFDQRLYVEALYRANPGRISRVEGVDVSDEALGRGKSEQETIAIYRSARVIAGHTIWIPSEGFIRALRDSGQITSGQSIPSKVWQAAGEVAGAAVDAVKYTAGIVAGVLQGAWQAVLDLFVGAAEMAGEVLGLVWKLITADLAGIADTIKGWVDGIGSLVQNAGNLVDGFVAKWNTKDAWERGVFQGEVLGWVLMTILLMWISGGAAVGGVIGVLLTKFPMIAKAIKVADALQTVSTYAKATRLPGKAATFVRGKLGEVGQVTPELPKPKPAPGERRIPEHVVRNFARTTKLTEIDAVVANYLPREASSPDRYKLIDVPYEVYDTLGNAADLIGWEGDVEADEGSFAVGKTLALTPKGIRALAARLAQTPETEAGKPLRDFVAAPTRSSTAVAAVVGHRLTIVLDRA